jgi:hypothetical protein
MGLSVKALGLLEKMLLADRIVAETILPRVFYWIYVLITGIDGLFILRILYFRHNSKKSSQQAGNNRRNACYRSQMVFVSSKSRSRWDEFLNTSNSL